MFRFKFKNHSSYLPLFVGGFCLISILLFQNFDSSNSHISSNKASRVFYFHDHSTLMVYYSDQPYVVRDELDDQTDVTMNFAYIYPLVANFKWSVKRGFSNCD